MQERPLNKCPFLSAEYLSFLSKIIAYFVGNFEKNPK